MLYAFVRIIMIFKILNIFITIYEIELSFIVNRVYLNILKMSKKIFILCAIRSIFEKLKFKTILYTQKKYVIEKKN